MPASTLDGRLLHASGAAYAISDDEKVLAPDPKNLDLAGAGFLRPPTVITAGRREVDACLVGEMAEGPVVVFRGTLPFNLHGIPTVRDWLNDFEARPIPFAGFPGFLHEGFAQALAGLSPGISDELKRIDDASPAPGRPILITGHSKGGALAALAAWEIEKVVGRPVKVVTFAAARPGDETFGAAYDAAGIDHVRYEYGNDIVPHLPLSKGGFVDLLANLPLIGGRFAGFRRFDYRPVGRLRYITRSGRIVAEDPTLRSDRDLTLALEILRGRLLQVATDHAIGRGSGYRAALDPDGGPLLVSIWHAEGPGEGEDDRDSGVSPPLLDLIGPG